MKGLVNFFGGYTLSEISPSLINDFKIKRRDEGVKPATIHRQLDIMKRAFNLAIREWEWWDKNPVTRVSLEKLNNKRDRWLTFEEEETLLQVLSCLVRRISPFWLEHRDAAWGNSFPYLERG